MQINNRIFLVHFNANNQNITSPSVEDLYPVSVLVESISTKQPKRRKIKIVLRNCPIINQDLQYMHLSVQNLFSQEQRSDLPIAGRSKHFKKKNWKIDIRHSDFGNNRGLSNPIFIRTNTHEAS